MAGGGAGAVAHRALLFGWRYLPFWFRWLAVRLLYPRFLLGAVVIVRNAEGHVLLVRQTYHRDAQWGAPGGWVGRGELPRAAAEREAFEEVGLRVRAGRVLAVSHGSYGEVTMAFEAQSLDDAVPRLSDEIDQVAFFAPDALPSIPSGHRGLVVQALHHDDSPDRTPR